MPTFTLAQLHELCATLGRILKLGVSLLNVPFIAFDKATARLPRETEAERPTVERIGQTLIGYWKQPLSVNGHR